jgi:hypothetical protein
MRIEAAKKLAALADALENSPPAFYNQNNLASCAMAHMCRSGLVRMDREKCLAPDVFVYEHVRAKIIGDKDVHDYVFGVTRDVERAARWLGVRYNKCDTAQHAVQRIDHVLKLKGFEVTRAVA